MPETIDVQYFTNRWLDFNRYPNNIRYLSHENNLIKVGNGRGYELTFTYDNDNLILVKI